MPSSEANSVLRYIRKVTAAQSFLYLADPDLLARFISRRDETAFAALVRRHGPMVLGLCLRILRNEQDAEDAFQATFLVFSRMAHSLRPQKSLAGWLYSVAYRTAQKVRLDVARRHKREGLATSAEVADPLAQITLRETHEILDRELTRLPDKFRVPLVLCYLEGLTRDEAALRLNWPVGLLKSRLEQGRERLRARLASRGLALSGIFVASTFFEGTASAAVPPVLLSSTVQAGTAVAGVGAAISLVLPRVAALSERMVMAMFVTKVKTAGLGLLLLGMLGLGTGLYTQRVLAGRQLDTETPTLERGRGDSVRLPPQMLAKLGIQAVEVKPRSAHASPVLQLPGSLALDPQRLSRVRSRFAPFEVLEIGRPDGQDRPFRPLDKVRKGQALAVLSSADVSQRKHDLFSALVQLKLDETILERAEGTGKAVPEVTRLLARRNVEADRNTVARALNVLKAWDIPEDEIAAVRKEVREAGAGGKPNTGDMSKSALERWAKFTLRSPMEGTIVECNISQHEIVNDGSVNLFQVANLDQLLVLAHVSTADLPKLQALRASERRWTVWPPKPDPNTRAALLRLMKTFDKGTTATDDRVAKSYRPFQEIERSVNKPVEGFIDEVGSLIDPNLDTAVVKGHIDNKEHQMRPGLFVTATVALPMPVADVALPSSALVESGQDTFVFVQRDAKNFNYEQRRVFVMRRGKDTVHIRARLTPEQVRQGFQTVRAGEQVISSGALELKAILDDLKEALDR
jgi:RNA polymerase sigma factor (sigma-70 family)